MRHEAFTNLIKEFVFNQKSIEINKWALSKELALRNRTWHLCGNQAGWGVGKQMTRPVGHWFNYRDWDDSCLSKKYWQRELREDTHSEIFRM